MSGTGLFKKKVKNTVENPVTGVASMVSEEDFTFALKTVPGMSRFVLDSAQIADMDSGQETIMSGGKIKTGFINANYIAVDKITSSNYAVDPQSVYSNAGTMINLLTGAIEAPNFSLTSTGDAYFKGTVNATAGKIAGWSIDGDKLHNNNTYVLDAGATTTKTINSVSRSNLVLAIGSNFGVSSSGILYCSGANFSGDIPLKYGPKYFAPFVCFSRVKKTRGNRSFVTQIQG